MSKMIAKCYYCNNEFEVEDLVGSCECPHCKKEVDKEKAFKYNKSLTDIVNEEKIVAHGENYKKVKSAIERGDFYVEKKEYENAKKEYEGALELSNSDPFIWFGLVKVMTKNFTDYRCDNYKEYLDKAYKYADTEELEMMKKQFSEYYAKTKLSDSELESEINEETKEMKELIELGLKEMMPEFASKQKSLKKNLLLAILLGSVTAILMVLFFILKKDWILYPVILTIGGGYYFIRRYMTDKDLTRIFDVLLDLYDGIEGFDLNSKAEYELYEKINNLCGSIYDKEPSPVISKNFSELGLYLAELNVDKVDTFIEQHKYLYNNI